MMGYGAMETQLHSFSASELFGGERSASCSSRLTPEDSVCCTDGARRCVGASAALDILKKLKFSCLYRQSKQPSSGVQDALFEMRMIKCILADTDRQTSTFMGPCIANIFQYIYIYIYIYIYPTICNFTQFIYIWKLLYMFRVVPPPIIRSANNCIYSNVTPLLLPAAIAAGSSNGLTLL